MTKNSMPSLVEGYLLELFMCDFNTFIYYVAYNEVVNINVVYPLYSLSKNSVYLIDFLPQLLDAS